MNTLQVLLRAWESQKSYNQKVRAKEHPDDFEYWMKQYLLGMVSEVDSVLDQIHWKAHRRGQPTNLRNVGRELADLTKYVLSMWDLAGYDMDELLLEVEGKGRELEFQYYQDFETHYPKGSRIVITDIDGTLGDWRVSFLKWVKAFKHLDLPADDASTLALDTALRLSYPAYAALKDEFEASGGYAMIATYPDVVSTFKALFGPVLPDYYMIAYTARPAKVHSRIWADTWTWFALNGLSSHLSELRIGADERILRAEALTQEGHEVLFIEDDPGLALRAVSIGLPVLLRDQPYNQAVSHSLIKRFKTLTPDLIQGGFFNGK